MDGQDIREERVWVCAIIASEVIRERPRLIAGIGGRILARLTAEEIDAFLSQPLNAHLVTLRASGTPHVAPVWFLWDEGRAYVMADAGAVKVRNIRRNPAVAVCVATPGRPYAFVTIEGAASTGVEGMESMVHRICVNYDGPERGPEFAQELLADERMTLITITPDRVMSWKDDSEGEE